MNINTIKGMKKAESLKVGKHEVIFNGLNYWTEKDGTIKGAFIKVLDFKDIFIPISDNNTTQIDYLLDQLSTNSYDPTTLERYIGTTISVLMKERITAKGTFLNADFNPNAKEDTNPSYSHDAFADA